MQSIRMQCQKAIRLELKNRYKHVKFKVTSRAALDGDSVTVKYLHGVDVKEVDDLLMKYRKYEETGCENIPKVHYVFVRDKQYW